MFPSSHTADDTAPKASDVPSSLRMEYAEIVDEDNSVDRTSTVHFAQSPLLGPMNPSSRLTQHQRYPPIEQCSPIRGTATHDGIKFTESDESDTDELIENVASTPFMEKSRQWRKDIIRTAVVVAMISILTTLNFLILAGSQEITLDIAGFQEFKLLDGVLYCDIAFEVMNPNIQSVKIYPFKLNFRLYSNESDIIYLGYMDSNDYTSLASATSDYELKEVPVTFVLDGDADVDLIRSILLTKDFELKASGRLSYQMMLSKVSKHIAHVSSYSQQQRVIIDDEGRNRCPD